MKYLYSCYGMNPIFECVFLSNGDGDFGIRRGEKRIRNGESGIGPDKNVIRIVEVVGFDMRIGSD